MTGLVACVVFLLLAAGPATAHRVTVFAWVEGDYIHVEGKFAGGKKVKQGKITVFDLQGNGLLEGMTDAQGKFSFKAPQKRALKIVLDAGMGHRAEWTLESEDILSGGLAKEGTVTARETDGKKPKKGAAEAISTTDDGPDEFELAVERAIDKKLEPIMKMLSEFQEKRVSLKDILGGIGYILGLMGVAAYFHYRRRSAGAGREKD